MALFKLFMYMCYMHASRPRYLIWWPAMEKIESWQPPKRLLTCAAMGTLSGHDGIDVSVWVYQRHDTSQEACAHIAAMVLSVCDAHRKQTHSRLFHFFSLVLVWPSFSPALVLILQKTSYYTQWVHCLILFALLCQGSDTVCALVSFNISRQWTPTEFTDWKLNGWGIAVQRSPQKLPMGFTNSASIGYRYTLFFFFYFCLCRCGRPGWPHRSHDRHPTQEHQRGHRHLRGHNGVCGQC